MIKIPHHCTVSCTQSSVGDCSTMHHPFPLAGRATNFLLAQQFHPLLCSALHSAMNKFKYFHQIQSYNFHTYIRVYAWTKNPHPIPAVQWPMPSGSHCNILHHMGNCRDFEVVLPLLNLSHFLLIVKYMTTVHNTQLMSWSHDRQKKKSLHCPSKNKSLTTNFQLMLHKFRQHFTISPCGYITCQVLWWA